MGFYKSPSDLRKERKQKRIDRKPELLAQARRDRKPLLPKFSSDNVSKKMDQTVHMLPGMSAMGVLRYTMMPEILPRIRAIGMHFGHFAYLLALVFSSARLIPHTHPSLNAANIGRYGVRQVIAIAANNITWSRKNIDQIGIFSAIVIGLIMIVIQAGLIAVAAFMGVDNPASAQGFFETPNPQNDPVMIMFANVFGSLNDFWGAGVAANAPNSGNVVHQAIYAMLSLYSTAMMVIAVIIVLYYVMTVVGEAAKTGTPFGQRFNSLWAPIRLVVALGLLVPLGSGLNSAQYLTLTIAKMGSGLGTQVWNVALAELNPSNSERYILGDFNSSWVRGLAYHVLVMEVCMQAQNKYNQNPAPTDSKTVKAIGGDNNAPSTTTPGRGRNPDRVTQAVYSYDMKWQNEKWFTVTGGVYCGNVSIDMSEEDLESSISTGSLAVPTEEIYRQTIIAIEKIVNSTVIKAEAKKYVDGVISVDRVFNAMPPDGLADVFTNILADADTIETELMNAFDGGSIPRTDMATKMQEFIDSRGDSWVYAGTYYLEIARISQASNEARLGTIPNTAIITVDEELEGGNRSGQSKRNGSFWIKGADNEVSEAVGGVVNFYAQNSQNYIPPAVQAATPQSCQGINKESGWLDWTGCLILSMLVPENLVILASDEVEARSVDPLSALIGAGYTIVDRSWKFLLAGLIASTGGAVASLFTAATLGPVALALGGIAKIIAPFLILIGVFGLTAGVVLYFMLPILPFMYFFFAVVSWVMEIFEAVIAMPLWALAHLRIDGEGMPGQAAINGYYLLLAILLRPVLIVIGLFAGILIFGGIVFLLQNLWAGVLLVKGDGGMVGLEVLIYTLVFAYFCYSAALTCFKLVDTIPNQILRWIGSGTPTFSDGKEDAAGGASNVLTAGAGFLAGSGLNQASSAISQGAEQGVKGLKNTKFGKGLRSEDEVKQADYQENLMKKADRDAEGL